MDRERKGGEGEEGRKEGVGMRGKEREVWHEELSRYSIWRSLNPNNCSQQATDEGVRSTPVPAGSKLRELLALLSSNLKTGRK